MNCKLNIKAPNGANSLLYQDIIKAINNPKQAIDTYYYTKTDEFKSAYRGTLDVNGEPKYTEFSKEAYLHEVDYSNIELEKSADVYKRLIDDVPKILDVISNRIAFLTDTGSKEHIDKLKDIYNILENEPINSGIPRFVEMAKSHVFGLKRLADSVYKEPVTVETIKKLAGIHKVAQSYSIVYDLKNALSLSSEVEKIFDEGIKNMSSIIGSIDTIETLYYENSIKHLANEFHKRNQTWSKAQIKEELSKSSRDIVWHEQMLDYMGDSHDKTISMVASIMMEAEHNIRRLNFDFAEKLNEKLKPLEKKYKSKDVFKNLIVEASNGELHVVDPNVQFTNGKSKLADTMFNKLKEIKNDPDLMDFLLFYHETMQNLEAALPPGAKLGTRLPTVLKSEFELLEGKTMKERASLIHDNTIKRFHRSNLDTERGLLTDVAGKPIRKIPTFYTQKYDSANYELKYNKVYKKAIEEGLTEEAANMKAHTEAESYAIGLMKNLISTDLSHSLQRFHAMATNYSSKNELIHIFESAEAVISSKHRTYTVVDSGGKIIVDKANGREKTISGDISRTAKLLTTFVDMQLYGQKELDLGFIDAFGFKLDTNKLLRGLNKQTGLIMQAGNVIGGINNFVVGTYNNFLESKGGEYYTGKDYLKALGTYKKDLFNIVADVGERTPKSLVNLLDAHYNIMQSYESENIKTSERSKASRLMKTSSLYFIQASGEHLAHMSAGMAMMNNIKMYNKDGTEAGSLLENNKIVNGKLQVPFDLFIKERDGSLVKFDTNQQNRISNKIGAVLRKLQGNYSKNTATLMQQDARTALVMKFRGWITEAVKRRYGKKRDYHMLETEMEGFYRTGFKALGVLMKDLKSFSLQLSKENWKNLTPHEKANIRRFITEASMIAATFVASALLANAGKIMEERFDDEDLYDRFVLGSFAMLDYQVSRLYTETFAFINPAEAVKLLATPAASISVLENTVKLLGQVASLNWTEEYESGWREGQNKLLVKLEKLVPLYKQIMTLNPDGIKDRGIFYN